MRWFSRKKRVLPWRDIVQSDSDHRAYMILVSEVMLQQTQVSRVKIVFKDFLQRFPQIEDLASASNREILLAWKGMGYNRRALLLRDAARIICEQHGGVFPREMDELRAIPGIGPYTAAAIRNFAFDLPTPCLDTNIRRILHLVFVGPEENDGAWMKSDRELLILAQSILEQGLGVRRNRRIRNIELNRSSESSVSSDSFISRGPAAWHAALMDFGSLVCTKRRPTCDACPLAAKGLCKSAGRVPASVAKKKSEPGRMVGSTFVPNRIFRGKVVEALREAKKGLTLDAIGKTVCLDWNPSQHRAWLQRIVTRLAREKMLREKKGTYVLG